MHNVRWQPALLIRVCIALQAMALPAVITASGQWYRMVGTVKSDHALLTPAHALQSEDA